MLLDYIALVSVYVLIGFAASNLDLRNHNVLSIVRLLGLLFLFILLIISLVLRSLNRNIKDLVTRILLKKKHFRDKKIRVVTTVNVANNLHLY